MKEETWTRFAEPIDAMRIQPNTEYYHITLLMNKKGVRVLDVYTQWVRHTTTKPRREIREAVLVDPQTVCDQREQMGLRCLIVHDDDQHLAWMLFGGPAVIEKGFAEEKMSRHIKPQEVSYAGMLGYESTQQGNGVANPKVSKSMRARLLKRDGHKCVKCGATPEDNPHVELNVHHVRPWGEGGATIQKNLVTLCRLCHKSLDPHFDPRLSKFGRTEHHESMELYRQIFPLSTLSGGMTLELLNSLS